MEKQRYWNAKCDHRQYVFTILLKRNLQKAKSVIITIQKLCKNVTKAQNVASNSWKPCFWAQMCLTVMTLDNSKHCHLEQILFSLELSRYQGLTVFIPGILDKGKESLKESLYWY